MHVHPNVLGHLDQLRRRLFWVLGTIGASAALALAYSDVAFEVLMHPGLAALQERGRTLIATSPPELFLVYFKTALLAGFLLSLPMTLYQGWALVAAGLYANERRYALPFVLCTTLLFFAGAGFGYAVAFPFVFDYFLGLEAEYVQSQWTMQSLFSFLSTLYLAFGIAFQLPVVMVFLALAGVLSAQTMASGRRYAIVAMFVIGAVLTPPDVVSQLALALPLIALYELGLLGARLLTRSRAEPAPSEA
jgi:sec-independent protein translocase protein TatC